MSTPRPYELIAKKRDGFKLSKTEIAALINLFLSGEMTSEQMAAWLMAAYIHGLDFNETAFLTEAMATSGEILDLRAVPGLKVDKHSTGGVGDKVSLVVVPLVAALGVKTPKLSGRSLGHTGGTIDKLSAIPGIKLELTPKQIIKQLNEIGGCFAAQSPTLVPADKKIYQLRDLTATVNSIGLITSSILSKKLAAGAERIVIDVKAGSGAFMTNVSQARQLAYTLVKVGERLGLKVRAVISDMNQPLGRAVGYALEVKEALDCLQGLGPPDLNELCLELGAQMLLLAGKTVSKEEALNSLRHCLHAGVGLTKFQEIVKSQGGHSDFFNNPETFSPVGKFILQADQSGYLNFLDVSKIGWVAHYLAEAVNSEKKQAGVPIKYLTGLIWLKKKGSLVKKGDPLVEIYHHQHLPVNTISLIKEAIAIEKTEPKPQPLIYETV